MSTVKTNNVQIGQSVTATNNFTWYQPASPDGTVRLGNGNSGSVTDLVTLTSAGNLGIGTSSPGNRLHVNGSGDVARFTNSTQSAYVALDSGGFSILTGAGQTGNGIYASATNNTLQLFTNSSSKATLDSSGNLGLGVTPSAWGFGGAFELPGGSVINGKGNGLYLTANSYYNGGWKYATSSYASYYYQANSAHIWAYAASGTAGNAISFTQAMTLDASGNLLVGTTNVLQGSKLTVNGQIGAGVTYTISSSAATNISQMVSGLVYIRDNVTGNNCLVSFDSAGFMTFIVNTNSTFTNQTAPSANQIRLDFRADTAGLKATGGSSRNGTNIAVMNLVAL